MIASPFTSLAAFKNNFAYELNGNRTSDKIAVPKIYVTFCAQAQQIWSMEIHLYCNSFTIFASCFHFFEQIFPYRHCFSRNILVNINVCFPCFPLSKPYPYNLIVLKLSFSTVHFDSYSPFYKHAQSWRRPAPSSPWTYVIPSLCSLLTFHSHFHQVRQFLDCFTYSSSGYLKCS